MAARAYLFDFNGVLVDDERVHHAAFREVLAARGIALDEATYVARYLAFDDVTAFRAMLRDACVAATDAMVAECVAEKLPRYMKAIEKDLVLFPGAFELLRACAARAPVAIVSGALRVEIDHALSRAGATDAVTTIVAAEDVDACKPDPAGYREALRRLSIEPHHARQAVVIEDSLAGIAAGVAAGCRVVAVAHSYPIEALVAAGALHATARIDELTVEILDAADGAPA